MNIVLPKLATLRVALSLIELNDPRRTRRTHRVARRGNLKAILRVVKWITINDPQELKSAIEIAEEEEQLQANLKNFKF